MPRYGGGRATLSQGFDKEVCFAAASPWRSIDTFQQVFQVIRKLIDENSPHDDRVWRPTALNIYEKIKHSNSSLNRKSKKLLEDSIERALEVLNQDEDSDDGDSIEGEFDGIEITESKVGSGVISSATKLNCVC